MHNELLFPSKKDEIKRCTGANHAGIAPEPLSINLTSENKSDNQ